MEFEFEIEGLRELERAMLAMGRAPARRMGVSAVRASAKVIIDRAKEVVPVDTGQLKNSLAARIKKREDNEVLYALGSLRPRGRIFHLVEFGTVYMPPNGFFRKALDEKAQEAFAVMATRLAGQIEKDAASNVTRAT